MAGINPLQLPTWQRAPEIDFSPLARLGETWRKQREEEADAEILQKAQASRRAAGTPLANLGQGAPATAPAAPVTGGAVASGGASYPMAISERGEVGAAGSGRQGNISSDTGGSRSYGVLGVNSRSGSAASFAKAYPDLGLTAQPGTPEFDNQWRTAASTRSDQLYAAQKDWYEKNILAPTKAQLASVNPALANDQRVVGYLADRRVQMGGVGENAAMGLARSVSDPDAYIKALSDNDRQNLPSYFKTYLSQNPNNLRGLENRVALRDRMSRELGGAPTAYAPPAAPDATTRVASLAPFAPDTASYAPTPMASTAAPEAPPVRVAGGPVAPQGATQQLTPEEMRALANPRTRAFMQHIIEQRQQQERDARDYQFRREEAARNQRNADREFYKPQVVGSPETGWYIVNPRGQIPPDGAGPPKAGGPAQPVAPARPGVRPAPPQTADGQASPSGVTPIVPGKNADANIKGESELRKEFESVAKAHMDNRRSYQRILSSEDNAVGDISLIFGYMRMLDPGSVVREGEFATAQNAAGIPERIQNTYNRLLSGERLTPEQRESFKQQAGELYKSSANEYGARRKQYTDIAKSYKYSPDRVIPDIGPEPMFSDRFQFDTSAPPRTLDQTRSIERKQLPRGVTPATVVIEARSKVAAGASLQDVATRLMEYGINPSVLANGQ